MQKKYAETYDGRMQLLHLMLSYPELFEDDSIAYVGDAHETQRTGQMFMNCCRFSHYVSGRSMDPFNDSSRIDDAVEYILDLLTR